MKCHICEKKKTSSSYYIKLHGSHNIELPLWKSSSMQPNIRSEKTKTSKEKYG